MRRPRLRIVNIPGGTMTADLIAESARRRRRRCDRPSRPQARDAASIATRLDGGAAICCSIVGGSGVGRTDATVTALAERGEVIAHGIALQPGRTAAVGRIGKTPVVVLPGAPDQAFAAWWTLALPVLDRLSGRRPRRNADPAAGAQDRLQRRHCRDRAAGARSRRLDARWRSGDLSLEAIARADAWLVVPGGSEGFAAGTPVDAYMLRE